MHKKLFLQLKLNKLNIFHEFSFRINHMVNMKFHFWSFKIIIYNRSLQTAAREPNLAFHSTRLLRIWEIFLFFFLIKLKKCENFNKILRNFSEKFNVCKICYSRIHLLQKFVSRDKKKFAKAWSIIYNCRARICYALLFENLPQAHYEPLLVSLLRTICSRVWEAVLRCNEFDAIRKKMSAECLSTPLRKTRPFRFHIWVLKPNVLYRRREVYRDLL